MAITVGADIRVRHPQPIVVLPLTFDASYPAGGYSLTPSRFRLSKVQYAIPTTFPNPNLNYLFFGYYNIATSKFMIFDALGELAAGTDLSNHTAQLLVIGY